MQLETTRLILREYEVGDFADVHEYGSDPDVSIYDSWGPNTADDTRNFIRSMMIQAENSPRYKFEFAVFHREAKRVIGGASIRRATELSAVGDLGYTINPRFQKQGIATEAMRRLLKFGFEEMGLMIIYATCDIENAASCRVMEKLGMKRVGLNIKHREFKGRWHDSLRYEVTHLS